MFPHDSYRLAIILHEERIAAARTPRRDIPSVRVSRGSFRLPAWAMRLRTWLKPTPRTDHEQRQTPKAPEPASSSVQ
jgi:hypothetical protein